MSGEVNWYADAVYIALDKAEDALAEQVLILLDEEVKLAINRNDQIDTGFMINSAYWRTRNRSTYGGTWETGRYKDREGDPVARGRAPEAELGGALGVFGVAAEYAIFQELLQPFLWPALQRVAARTSRISITVEAGG